MDRVANLLVDEDWALIESLADRLHQELAAEQILDEISGLHYRPNLRHVLNAAWLARLTWSDPDSPGNWTPQEPDSPLSRDVRAVCLAVIDQTPAASTSAAAAPGRNPSLVRPS